MEAATDAAFEELRNYLDDKITRHQAGKAVEAALDALSLHDASPERKQEAVAMPTREQIARAVCNCRKGRNYDALAEFAKDWWRDEADAVLALIAEKPSPA